MSLLNFNTSDRLSTVLPCCVVVCLHCIRLTACSFLLFLFTGKEMGVPVTPYDDETETLVCKNKNIEGGMGIYFYKVRKLNCVLCLLF